MKSGPSRCMESQHSARRRQWKSAQELDRWRQAAEPRATSRDKVGGRKWCLSLRALPAAAAAAAPAGLAQGRGGLGSSERHNLCRSQDSQLPAPGSRNHPGIRLWNISSSSKPSHWLPAVQTGGWRAWVCGEGWGVRRGVQGYAIFTRSSGRTEHGCFSSGKQFF